MVLEHFWGLSNNTIIKEIERQIEQSSVRSSTLLHKLAISINMSILF